MRITSTLATRARPEPRFRLARYAACWLQRRERVYILKDLLTFASRSDEMRSALAASPQGILA